MYSIISSSWRVICTSTSMCRSQGSCAGAGLVSFKVVVWGFFMQCHQNMKHLLPAHSNCSVYRLFFFLIYCDFSSDFDMGTACSRSRNIRKYVEDEEIKKTASCQDGFICCCWHFDGDYHHLSGVPNTIDSKHL